MEIAMTIATLPLPAAVKAAAPVRKGWFQRCIDRAAAARLRQAEAEVRNYIGYLNPELEERASYKDGIGKNWTLPFIRGA
jgi:hypothetical protein